MTRNELRQRIAEYRKEGRWHAIVFFVIFFGEIFGRSFVPQDFLAADCFSRAFYPVIFGLLPVMLIYSFIRIRMKGLACLHCRARFIGELGEQVIVSGKCWKCESKVFKE